MSFQTIFNIQQSMTVKNRRVVGQQTSRSGQLTIAQYLTIVPWVFVVNPHSYLYYPQVRDVIQSIDNSDRQIPQNVTFDNDNLSWFTEYKGGLSGAEAAALTLAYVPAANSTVIIVGNIPVGTPGTVVLAAGDFIQLGTYVYKVANTAVRPGSGSTVSVTLNRPVIGTPATGTLTAVGSAVYFSLVAEVCPTYTLNPMTDGAFVQWDQPFVFTEYVV